MTIEPFALDTRTGWTEDLRFLLERYPRECWQEHQNLGQMARFWLDRHGMFRELGGALQASTVEFREGKVPVRDYQGWFVPRLQFFLSQLHAHHQVEDHHYFPVFRSAEQRLAQGFEVLESDHESIHETIDTVVQSANEFLRGISGGEDAARKAAELYAGDSDVLLRKLLRHLDDEEDLIIPLILDRGEHALGVG